MVSVPWDGPITGHATGMSFGGGGGGISRPRALLLVCPVGGNQQELFALETQDLRGGWQNTNVLEQGVSTIARQTGMLTSVGHICKCSAQIY